MTIHFLLSGAAALLLFAAHTRADEVYAIAAVSTIQDGQPVYVDDAEVARAIPQFAPLGPRAATCPTPFSTLVHIAYSPTVTGPHRALSNTLECDIAADDPHVYACRAQVRDRPVIYDVEPSQYFEIDSHTIADDALQVYRAFRDGQIRYADAKMPYFRTLRVRSITQEDGRMILHTGGCGCGETIAVEPASPGNGAAFIGQTIRALCL
jgi:hypothetical protein